MRLRRAGLMLVAVAVLGEGGHLLLGALGTDDHLFHVLFPLVAGAVFLDFVVRDVRQNGVPRFGWRLPPKPTRTAAKT